MRLRTIRDSFHAKFLNDQRVLYLIRSDDFEVAYKNANKDERKAIEAAVERADKETLVAFIKKKLAELTPFHQLTLRQLREIGRNIQIEEYWNKDKVTLLREIEDVVTRLKASG